jgi:hypothetical protein
MVQLSRPGMSQAHAMAAAVFFHELKAGLLEGLHEGTVIHGRETGAFALDFESADRRFRDARLLCKFLLVESGEGPRGATKARGESDHKTISRISSETVFQMQNS